MLYKDAGVDLDKAEKIKREIRKIAKRTYKFVVEGVGPFSAVLKSSPLSGKLLLATADGVGTKVKLAFQFGKLDGLGFDLVGMCVNDILAMHGKPLFFLDYIGVPKLDEKVLDIVKSIARACKEAECSLVGGETAQMPDFYQENSAELVGFCIGVLEPKNKPKPEKIKEGDIVVALPSAGFHSNGYSLLRKLLDSGKISPDDMVDGRKLKDHLLAPTKIYVKAFRKYILPLSPKVSAHITGGGLPENISRVIPDDFQVVILKKLLNSKHNRNWKIFRYVMEKGEIPEVEMFRVFNMGVGFVSIIPQKFENRIKPPLFKIGVVEKGKRKVVIE